MSDHARAMYTWRKLLCVYTEMHHATDSILFAGSHVLVEK